MNFIEKNVSSLLSLKENLEEIQLETQSLETEKAGIDLEEYIEGIADSVRIGLDQSIAILTPWFFNSMPKIYYQTTPRVEKVRHLSAIITGHIFETKQTVELWNRERNKVTYIGPGGDRKIIIDMAHKLKSTQIKMGSLYFSRENLLFLSTFFCKGFIPADKKNTHITQKIEEARKLLYEKHPKWQVDIDNFIKNLDNDFITYATTKRITSTFRMLKHMLQQEGAHTFVETYKKSPLLRISLGLNGIDISEVIEQIFHLIDRYNFDVVRAFIVQFEEGFKEPINVMYFVVKSNSSELVNKSTLSVVKLVKALRTLSWVDYDDYSKLGKIPYNFSINAVNLIRSVASWIHVLLGKENVYYFSEYQIYKTFISHVEITEQLVKLFRIKFDPLEKEQRSQGKYEENKILILQQIEELVDPVERKIITEFIRFADNTLKTNYFFPTKTGLAFRISPDALDPKFYPEKPFGIFFIIGRDYRLFHVRWRDISRGGLRIVLPKNTGDHSYALSGLFDEVYGLSKAQQLKNKDIPEGGSKAVLVLKPGGNKYRAARGSVNALLDLLVSEDESHEERTSKQISYYHDEEIIFLGPDENVTDGLINWIALQAERRGYKYAKAFISSKPQSGINHKKYGVTSEGVNVYLEYALRYLGIDPRKNFFTIKMTGGPDGDVAGNELKILHREYGENARVIAIGDGYGAAYDPQGLDWNELLRLVATELPISFFEKSKLSNSPESFVISADTRENIRKRNDLHNIIEADIFIPAGGRPYTINDKNWEQFLTPLQRPSCKAVIEGANIFFTDNARTKLQEHGLLMIKDSSANKTGVICSSFEIISSLLLSDKEFNDIKEVYISQVIDILRLKASLEAKLLFSEVKRLAGKVNLVSLSLEISKEINDITDILLHELSLRKDEILKKPMFKNLLIQYCPQILREKFHDRIFTLPIPHIVAILSAHIASYIVYNEGLGWLKSMGGQNTFEAIMTYMNYDSIAGKLIEAVENSNLEFKKQIKAILELSAARDLTTLEFAKNE